MCLAIIATNVLHYWPLIIVANRDELHSRPTLAASPWSDAAHILGGRDLSAGGTWLGMTAHGRLALLTNYREPGMHNPQAPSRGQLTDEFLREEVLAQHYAEKLRDRGLEYNGFNLLLVDRTGLWYCSNRGHNGENSRAQVSALPIKPGVVGISNASLDSPWPKLTRTKQAVHEHLAQKNLTQPIPERLFEIMQDTRSASVEELTDTGVGPEREKLLGSPFIKNERYGTRCTTLIMQRADGMVRFHEKRFDAMGRPDGESLWTIDTMQGKISAGISSLDAHKL